jgi:hypothetical protein
MSKGPLAVRWGDWTLAELQAGTATVAHVELANAGTVPWRGTIFLAYHWLDERDNPIHWDGVRTSLPPLEPGEQVSVEATVRVPIPPGRYRFALDLVAENRSWFSQLGSSMAVRDVEVGPRDAPGAAHLPDWVEPGPGWEEQVAAAHAEGYAVVAGAVDWPSGLLQRRPQALEPYRPGPGRIPHFSHPLLCPSVVDSIRLEELPAVEGLPAFAAPTEEPWIYDGRIILRVRR